MRHIFRPGGTEAALSATLLLAMTVWGMPALAQSAAPGAPAPITPPPAGSLATVRTSHSWSADGTRVDRKSSSYRDTSGVAEDKMRVRTTRPVAPPVSTTSSSSTYTQSTKPPQ